MSFCLTELGHLHERLSPEERDEPLKCLLIAASRGGEAMIKVLEQTLLCHTTEELCEEHRSQGWGTAGDSNQFDMEGEADWEWLEGASGRARLPE